MGIHLPIWLAPFIADSFCCLAQLNQVSRGAGNSCINESSKENLMRRLMQVTLLAWLCTFGANVTLAQRVTGTLRGQILDPAGSSVANAQVTAMNEDTGVSVTMTTTSAGTYNFPSVLPGKYTVTVETSGFKKLVSPGVLVQAYQNTAPTPNLALETPTQ